MTENPINKTNPLTGQYKSTDGEYPLGVRIFLTVLVVFIGLIFLLVLWLRLPVLTQMAIGTYTPSPRPPTRTPLPTRTATITSTPTETPLPTATSLPPSANLVYDLDELQPPIPGVRSTAIVLSVPGNAVAAPDFTDQTWYPSSQIEEDMLANGVAIEFTHPFYATYSSASIMWNMDVPLDTGLYEIYVLDTLYSSGGSLDFQFRVGETHSHPLVVSTQVDYQLLQGNPPQKSDIWHSIGVYDVNNSGLLTVASSWQNRDEYSVVAVERVLIVKLPASTRQLIDALPQGAYRVVIDDNSAKIGNKRDWIAIDNKTAWGNNFMDLINPPADETVIWELPDSVPVGRYEVLAWIPEIKGNPEVSYNLTGNGFDFDREESGTPPITQQGNWEGGKWVSLGYWTVPELYGKTVRFVVTMKIKGGGIGDVAADALAFILQP